MKNAGGMENEEHLTVAQAAAELGVPSSVVHAAFDQRRLSFIEKYGIRLVRRSQLEAYREQYQSPGEDPKG